ncbi:hypothetical protein CRE_08753 [Caenorhabditis remanei]|uniref:Nuclear Hormone Receptor family n=1 Tax=Caenorhabditis remanei TaxID=31234 RepID=E3LHC5_CAERE|nr:hypothetical protein CRE_08753 [Caenorhabditis remanei]
MPPALHLTGPCEICFQPAHGRHFGVMSCRACAAFFRRAARSKSKSQGLVCERGNCTVSDTGIFYCKICRLKKCYEVGMDSSKFQNDRDLLSSSSHYAKHVKLAAPQSLSNFLGRPEMILFCEPENASTSKVIIDLSFLIDKAVKVFQMPTESFPSPCHFENSLEKMAYALEDMHITRNETKVEFQTKVGKFELFSFWEDSFIKTVQWFSKFPEFSELDMEVKLDILKSSWLIWIRLDKQAQTANLQRKQLLGADVYMTGEGRCMNLKNFDVDLSFATNYSMDQIRSLINVDVDTTWKPSVDALIKLDPTNVELNFMLIQLCLNHAQKKFSGKTREAIEKLLQIQADNLHNYYVKTMKTPYYSGRLTKMMKIIQFIEADVRRQRERFYLAKVFDIFTLDFSHPEMVEMF